MGMSDCIKCWDTPCTCGYEYRHMPKSARIELASVILGVEKKILTGMVKDIINPAHPDRYDRYISVMEKLPQNGWEVLAKFDGIYFDREVTFSYDIGGNYHFGNINEADGRGSQPATHWKKII